MRSFPAWITYAAFTSWSCPYPLIVVSGTVLGSMVTPAALLPVGLQLADADDVSSSIPNTVARISTGTVMIATSPPDLRSIVSVSPREA